MKTKLLPFFIVLLLCACKNETNNTAESLVTDASSASTSAYDHPDFSKKYNEYIQYQNYNQTRLNSIYDTYYNSFNADKEIGKNNFPNVSSIGSLTKIGEASKKEPDLGKLDEVSLALYDSIVKLNNLLKQARYYYHKGDYESDNFEKGKLLNEQTKTAFNNYFPLYNTFNSLLVEMGDELTQRDLEAYKKAGNLVRYNLLASINEADKMIGFINSQEKLSETDVNALDKHINTINTYATALEELSLDEEAVKKEVGFRYSSVPGYISELSSFIGQCRNFKERVETNNWKTPISHPQIKAKGTIEKVNGVYKNLITNYNSTI